MGDGAVSSRAAELRAKMAVLQKELEEEISREEGKKRGAEAIRVSATPSPKRRKTRGESSHNTSPSATFPRKRQGDSFQRKHDISATLGSSSGWDHPNTLVQKSGVALALGTFNATVGSENTTSIVPPRHNTTPSSSMGGSWATLSGRSEDLTVIEDLQPGPYHFNPPLADPHFKRLEPHSNINLKSRATAHEVVQEHLRGRFYISPSMLYSVARLARGGHNYEVPVAGEWVTIGVIAERGQISVSRGYGSRVQHSTAEAQGQSQLDDLCESSQGASEVVHKSAKKYLTLRLVDFGRRGQDPTTGKSVIKGDALLNMILFESDTVSSLKDAGGSEQRVYKGGSGGVFEASSTLREGAVIVVTNPRILKPFQRAKDKPHPMDNIFAITPQHEASVMIIGTSQDLGKCSALRRDGTTCKSWYDRRVSDVCEYHIQRAVESRRASRPEFSSATGGMLTGLRKGRAGSTLSDYSRKRGLLPRQGSSDQATKDPSSGTGATYVFPGHVARFDTGEQFPKPGLRTYSPFRISKPGPGLGAQGAEIAQSMESGTGRSQGMGGLVCAGRSIKARDMIKTPSHTPAVTPPTSQRSVTCPFSASTIRRIGFDPLRISRERIKDNVQIRQVVEELRNSQPNSEGGSSQSAKATRPSRERVGKAQIDAGTESDEELEII